MKRCVGVLVVVAAALTACSRKEVPEERTTTVFVPAPPPPERAEPPLEARTVEVPGDMPVWVVTGPGGSCPTSVFMHGMCGHGLGYIQAFQGAARAHGGVLALQGDMPCGGDGVFRKYAFDLKKQDARIQAALATCAGGGEPGELTLIGYSQGAHIAERLAELFPKRYTRLILLGAPTTPAAGRLVKLRGAVLIAGEHDATYRMKEGAQGLRTAGVPALYIEMPGANHGQLLEGEKVMAEALGWLAKNAR